MNYLWLMLFVNDIDQHILSLTSEIIKAFTHLLQYDFSNLMCHFGLGFTLDVTFCSFSLCIDASQRNYRGQLTFVFDSWGFKYWTCWGGNFTEGNPCGYLLEKKYFNWVAFTFYIFYLFCLIKTYFF